MDSKLDARVTPEPRSCELSASDQTVSNRELVAMAGSYVDVRTDTDTQTLPGVSTPTEALGFLSLFR